MRPSSGSPRSTIGGIRTRLPSLFFASPARAEAVDAPTAPLSGGEALRATLLQVWRVARPLVFLVPLMQMLALLWLAWKYTPTAPYWDEWVYVTLVQHANQGTLTFNDFWAFHYFTHRIVVPRLLDLALIELTHWNRQIIITFDLGIGVATGALLLASARRTLQSANATLAVVIPLSLLVFSWAQYENWMELFQVAFIATVFGVALCLYALRAEPLGWGRFSLAVLGALIATCSSAAGLMVWIAFVPSMLRAGYQRLLAWIGIAVVVWVAYLQGYPSHFDHPAPWELVTFVLAYLGAPVAYPHALRSELVAVFGLVLLAASVAIYWKLERSISALVIWLELALYAAATATLTASGRALHGPAGGLTSRYQTFGALFWVAVVVVSALVIQQVARRLTEGSIRVRQTTAHVVVACGVLALVAIASSSSLANVAGLRTGKAVEASLQQHQGCIAHFETAPDSCLGLWFPISNKTNVLQAAAYLKAQHLAIFRSTPR